MLGFLFGTACLLGFFYHLRRPEGGPGCRGPHAGHRAGRHWVSFLSRRIDATPAQEKVMRDAATEVRERVSALRGELRDIRGSVANEFRGEHLDPDWLVSELGRVDDALHELRRVVAGRLVELHASLDPDQRRMLADTLERGPRHRWRGPYRTADGGAS
ncbi:MAG: periplasmic heavy metal sensor [Polyangiaceae bacterium]